jgi:hypothetical protein
MFSSLIRALLIATLLSRCCFAQSSRKPLFPLPTSLAEFTITKALSPELRAAIAPAIANSACKPNGSETYGTATVDLHETRVTLVRVDEPCLCGPSANCPIYAVEKNKLVLPDGEGFAYAISTNPKSSTPDLLIASHLSSKVTSLQRYRWKGSRFKLQDCEAAVPKDDAKSKTWSPEELEITTCDAIALK